MALRLDHSFIFKGIYDQFKWGMYCSIFGLLLSLFACVSNPPPISNQKTIYIPSQIYQEEREIYIQLPKALQEQKGKRYPVIVVLDGDRLFEYVAGLIPLMTEMNLVPECVVVGIPPANRDKELTPDPLDDLPESGGGRQFAQFLNRELFPYLHQEYPVLNYRTTIGHSYGGLWALFALSEQADLFSNYIAVDPSYRFYKKKSLPALSHEGPPKRLFLAIANTLSPGQDTSTLDAGRVDSHAFEIFQLRDQLLVADSLSLEFSWSYYPDHTHNTLPIPGIYDGLKAVFSWYPMIVDSTSLKDNCALSSQDVLQYIQTYIQDLREEMGSAAMPDNLPLRRAAWKNYARDKALTLEILRLNHQFYPDSFDANHALGLYYYYQKQKDEALRYLTRALKIREDASVKALLKTLK
jgi:predicted alpha/beta superfamily hydrolase